MNLRLDFRLKEDTVFMLLSKFDICDRVTKYTCFTSDLNLSPPNHPSKAPNPFLFRNII